VKRLVFVGSKRLGARVLEESYRSAPDSLVAVVTFDDSKDPRCALDEFSRFSAATGVPLHVLSRPSELPATTAAARPDLCLVAGWYSMLTSDALRIPPHGWVGVHASLLPRYRGGAPLVWALINGEEESGVTLFYFDEGMDSGDIVAQERFRLGPDETIADAVEKAESTAVSLVKQCCRALIEGRAPRTPQEHHRATYGAMRTPADGRICWNRPARDVHNFVRAQTRPYPGAFANVAGDGRVVHVWQAAPFSCDLYGIPGQVALIDDSVVPVVACGGGTALRLLSIEIEGVGQAAANGSPSLRAGTRLA